VKWISKIFEIAFPFMGYYFFPYGNVFSLVPYINLRVFTEYLLKDSLRYQTEFFYFNRASSANAQAWLEAF